MITPQQATQLIFAQAPLLPIVTVSLAEACGKVLRENIHADRDFPPFDRVTMDGIAYDIDHLPTYPALNVAGTQFAGEPPQALSRTGECWEVMTGAVLPQGTNTVTRYEDVIFSEQEGKKIARLTVPPQIGQNVHRQGTDQKQGALLLSSGTFLYAAEIAVAASVGKAKLQVSAVPRIIILSTGDELVEIEASPLPHQIRKSNAYTLQAALMAMGIPATLRHLPDTWEATQAGLTEALNGYEAVIISGGVSKGKRDYVPEALTVLGVQQHFHRVQQRPGKPFWFGTHPDGPVVFALPGNPVSTFLCFYRYVKSWLIKSAGATTPSPIYAVLNRAVSFAPDLTYFLPVQVSSSADGTLRATPVTGHGSGDFANLLLCHGFLELPAEREQFQSGEVFPLWLFRDL